jgi:hypothetical protein
VGTVLRACSNAARETSGQWGKDASALEVSVVKDHGFAGSVVAEGTADAVATRHGAEIGRGATRGAASRAASCAVSCAASCATS